MTEMQTLYMGCVVTATSAHWQCTPSPVRLSNAAVTPAGHFSTPSGVFRCTTLGKTESV